MPESSKPTPAKGAHVWYAADEYVVLCEGDYQGTADINPVGLQTNGAHALRSVPTNRLLALGGVNVKQERARFEKEFGENYELQKDWLGRYKSSPTTQAFDVWMRATCRRGQVLDYPLEDGSHAVEFLAHPMRPVLVVDKDHLQLMWRHAGKTHSLRLPESPAVTPEQIRQDFEAEMGASQAHLPLTRHEHLGYENPVVESLWTGFVDGWHARQARLVASSK